MRQVSCVKNSKITLRLTKRYSDKFFEKKKKLNLLLLFFCSYLD